MALLGDRNDIDINGWARQVFTFSIITITALSLTMALDCNQVAPQWLVSG